MVSGNSYFLLQIYTQQSAARGRALQDGGTPQGPGEHHTRAQWRGRGRGSSTAHRRGFSQAQGGPHQRPGEEPRARITQGPREGTLHGPGRNPTRAQGIRRGRGSSRAQGTARYRAQGSGPPEPEGDTQGGTHPGPNPHAVIAVELLGGSWGILGGRYLGSLGVCEGPWAFLGPCRVPWSTFADLLEPLRALHLFMMNIQVDAALGPKREARPGANREHYQGPGYSSTRARGRRRGRCQPVAQGKGPTIPRGRPQQSPPGPKGEPCQPYLFVDGCFSVLII
jgi:hypothetical protein